MTNDDKLPGNYRSIDKLIQEMRMNSERRVRFDGNLRRLVTTRTVEEDVNLKRDSKVVSHAVESVTKVSTVEATLLSRRIDVGETEHEGIRADSLFLENLIEKVDDGRVEDEELIEPQPPGPEDCCMSGCEVCVYEVYQSELEEYLRKKEQEKIKQFFKKSK
ncbi:hypothetical protein BY996DRAFT_6409829 [Phakopsora pachyrhizi]|nr:hypothetical protein BY996DRAFT_6409829 [Phakopsora pachyrhizi]